MELYELVITYMELYVLFDLYFKYWHLCYKKKIICFVDYL